MKSSNSLVRMLLLAAFCLSLGSCKVKTPKGIVPQSKMERLLYDYHEAQAMAQNSSAPERNAELYTEAVLQKYGVSRREFNASMEYYTRHADMLYDIYERINKRYQNEMQAMGGTTESDAINYSSLSATGDTANVWTAATYALLTPQPGKNMVYFRIKADTSFRPKDRLEWHFTSRFVYREGRKVAQAVMAVRYAEGDSITSAQQSIYGEGDNVLTINAANLPIKQIEGFIYLDEPLTAENTKLLFVSKQSLVRFHAEPTPIEQPLSPADSAANAESKAKKAFIDSIQNAGKAADTADHFRPAPRKRAMPHRKR